jgi:predicted dehydrogenase
MEKVINTALCSFGMSGKVFHAPFLVVHPGFTLYGAWERSKKVINDDYPGVKSFDTYEALLEDPAVELVVVNTPNYTHYEYTKKALLAGKHVIVEKPFTATVAEGEELIALAKEQNKKISVYQNRRYDSDYRTVKKIVEEKWLGEVVEAEMHYDRYKEELSPKAHKETPGPGTGALYDLGSHLIDQALQLFGNPQAIFADITNLRPYSLVDDYFEILFYYPKKRVRLKCSYLVREPLPGYVIHGTKGSFIKAKTDVQETALQGGEKPSGKDWGKEPESERGFLHTEKEGEEIREKVSSLQGNYGNYYDGVYEALTKDLPMPVTAEDGLQVIRIIEKAKESNDAKKVVEL